MITFSACRFSCRILACRRSRRTYRPRSLARSDAAISEIFLHKRGDEEEDKGGRRGAPPSCLALFSGSSVRQQGRGLRDPWARRVDRRQIGAWASASVCQRASLAEEDRLVCFNQVICFWFCYLIGFIIILWICRFLECLRSAISIFSLHFFRSKGWRPLLVEHQWRELLLSSIFLKAWADSLSLPKFL